MQFKVINTGFTEKVDHFQDKVPEYDPRTGDHLWAFFTMYKCNDPAKAVTGEKILLDHENLLTISPPACYFCEREYTSSLAMGRCAGHP